MGKKSYFEHLLIVTASIFILWQQVLFKLEKSQTVRNKKKLLEIVRKNLIHTRIFVYQGEL